MHSCENIVRNKGCLVVFIDKFYDTRWHCWQNKVQLAELGTITLCYINIILVFFRITREIYIGLKLKWPFCTEMAKVLVNFVEKKMLNSKENVLFPMRNLKN